jgi:hypothetical protein
MIVSTSMAMKIINLILMVGWKFIKIRRQKMTEKKAVIIYPCHITSGVEG